MLRGVTARVPFIVIKEIPLNVLSCLGKLLTTSCARYVVFNNLLVVPNSQVILMGSDPVQVRTHLGKKSTVDETSWRQLK